MKHALIALAASLACLTLAAEPLPLPDRAGVPPSKLYDYGVMGPPATPAIVAAALEQAGTRLPAGPFAASWASIGQHYRSPSWFEDAKFGIFIHWGLFAVPAFHNEWYEKHMYAARREWHAENFGPHERFGYKDFIPLFKHEKFDATQWAALFKQAGARLVMPSAQHHDNFALWDSQVTPFNSVKMGPKQDLVGQLAKAVRAAGMKFGVSNHGIENFSFINPTPEIEAKLKAAKADLYDPTWGDFYNVADRSPAAMTRFLADWLRRNVELIDQYRPDLLWFDNGANLRVLDPLKLQVAAHYYNRARSWQQEVSISSKFVAYAPSNDDRQQVGSIIDFEKVGTRSPAEIRPGPWMVDDTIGSTWGYTRGMKVDSAPVVLRRLIDTVSKGGFYLLNISPMADGAVPADQQQTLREIGAWLAVNGEAIYGTRPWQQFGEGEWRFTSKAGVVYAIGPAGSAAQLKSLTPALGKVTKLELLGQPGELDFSQSDAGLSVQVPAGKQAFAVLKISGLLAGR